MNKNLESYIAYLPSFFDKKFCNKTIKELKKEKWFTHQFYDPNKKVKFSPSGDKELEVSNADNLSTKKEINNKLLKAIRAYLESNNFSWYNDFNGYTSVRFNRYKKNTTMEEHCDHIQSMFDGERKGIPTLSIIGCLNENYEGGELIFFQDKIIKMEMGSLLIFPSKFLFPHKINLIKKGTRYSFVSWVW